MSEREDLPFSEEIVVPLRSLQLDSLESCYTYVARDLGVSESDILLWLMECIEHLPHKIPLYGTLVGLLNTEDSDFAAKVVQLCRERIEESLVSGDCNKLRILIRFVAVLMSNNVIAPASLVEVLETLLSLAATTIDDEKGNPAWQPKADFHVFCIMASLPWAGIELLERAPDELERVMAGIEAYLNVRKPIVDTCFTAFPSSNDDYLVDLWKRIKHCQESGWKVESVPRPHLAFEAKLVTCQTHDFGPVTCPYPPEGADESQTSSFGRQHHEAEQKFPQRLRRLSIFPPAKTDECMAPVDRFVVEEYILDVLLYLNGRRKECAAYLANLPVPFRYEYVMAETIFSQLFLLPKPPFKPIYYTIVIIDLCKALPGAFPTVVAGAVRALFSKMDDLDIECRTRLIHWFAHHLSNFQFVWPWKEWIDLVDLPKWAPQRYFVQEVLEKEVRLAYYERIKQSLEDVPKLFELLPPKSLPYFKYTAENQDGCTESEMLLSTELTAMVKSKKTARDIQVWVEEKILPAFGQKSAIEIVVQTLFYLGAKSFTHMITVLERYGQVLSKLATDQSYQVFLIQEVSKVWQFSVQMTVIAIDRMMGYRIISNLSIISWVFGPDNVERFHTSDFLWEILRNAISKTVNRTEDLQRDIIAAQKALDLARAATSKANSNLQTAQSVLDSAETEEAVAQATAKAEWAKTLVEKRKHEEASAEETLDAKHALLNHSLREQEDLFISVFENFCSVLSERLSKASPRSTDMEEDKPSAMDIDNSMENGKEGQKKEQLTEESQWQAATLGQLSAVTRQYATEIWKHMDKLEAQVFSRPVHYLVLKTLNNCIRRI
ncbi:hypothetical protein KP509_38G051300 [Ceratopteris richardii]|uniref:MIF4G domain-containing protein n=1 Tax=Ceratopteris richardii TaxID=49495 RepID=A0A8T2Q400_CERRI|nr:hypothetical protein KP509_38G051300 [Ceratopteris richardii]